MQVSYKPACQIVHLNKGVTTMWQCLIFEIAGQKIALEISHIREIIGMCDINLVPHRSDGLLGVAELRNHHLPVFEFRIGDTRITSESCILVLRDQHPESKEFGLIVDSADGVRHIPTDTSQLPISEEALRQVVIPVCRFIKSQISYDGDQIWLMDPEGHFLDEEQLARVARLS